jgi:hypothetical protein
MGLYPDGAQYFLREGGLPLLSDDKAWPILDPAVHFLRTVNAM